MDRLSIQYKGDHRFRAKAYTSTKLQKGPAGQVLLPFTPLLKLSGSQALVQTFSNAWAIVKSFFRFYSGAKNTGRCSGVLARAKLRGIRWGQSI